MRITIVCSVLLLFACQPNQQLKTDLDTYKDRISNVLELELRNAEPDLSLGFAKKSALNTQIPTIEMNLREFYGIESCPLKQLIAQRNTALGKIALPSQRFIYEVEVLNVLKACIDAIKYKSESNQQTQDLASDQEKELGLLLQWYNAKQNAYDANWANLLTQSDELYSSFARSAGFISGDHSDDINSALVDLKYFLSLYPLSDSLMQQDMEDLELHLQSMAMHQFYARTWRSMLLITSELAVLNYSLKQRLAEFNCKSPSNKATLDIVRNVFSKYFLMEIQPKASVLNSYYYQLAPLMEKLAKKAPLPASFSESVVKHNTQTFENYAETMRQHIQLWQSFFSNCDISPQKIVN